MVSYIISASEFKVRCNTVEQSLQLRAKTLEEKCVWRSLLEQRLTVFSNNSLKQKVVAAKYRLTTTSNNSRRASVKQQHVAGKQRSKTTSNTAVKQHTHRHYHSISGQLR